MTGNRTSKLFYELRYRKGTWKTATQRSFKGPKDTHLAVEGKNVMYERGTYWSTGVYKWVRVWTQHGASGTHKAFAATSHSGTTGISYTCYEDDANANCSNFFATVPLSRTCVFRVVSCHLAFLNSLISKRDDFINKPDLLWIQPFLLAPRR